MTRRYPLNPDVPMMDAPAYSNRELNRARLWAFAAGFLTCAIVAFAAAVIVGAA
jgi:hypothetical protein